MADTNYAVAPGEYLIEWMEENRMSSVDTMRRLGWSGYELIRILTGVGEVTEYIAFHLERLTGIPQRTWESYERQYRGDLQRLTAQGGDTNG